MVEKKAETVTESDKIWDEIKNLPIDMFALPNQYVKQHVRRIKLTPNEVHLKLKSPAVVASLDATLAHVRGRNYVMEVTDAFLIVKRGAPVVDLPKPEPSEQ